MLVEAHLRALVDVRHGAPLPVEVALELRRDLRCPGKGRHVIDPSTLREGVERVDVVCLPERVGVGRERPAADLDAIADDPRREHECGAREHDADERDGALSLVPGNERRQDEG